MTKRELLNYYYDNRNINNEIALIGKATGLKYTFRHYVEYATGEDYWVHLKKGLLFDTIRVLEKYDLPKHYNDEEHDKLLKSLKVGDFIVVEYCDNIKVYLKKVDDDCFILCDNKGHISVDLSDRFFIYKIKDIINSSMDKVIKKGGQYEIQKKRRLHRSASD